MLENKPIRDGTDVGSGATVSDMAARMRGGVDVVFEAPRWSERWTLEDDVTMPESSEHRLACEWLESLLRMWIARTGRDAAVHANLALRWDEEHPKVGVDPDVCLVAPAPPPGQLRSLRTWEPGHHAPTIAIEVVSRDTARKDYLEGPAKYAASGTRELWIFDQERCGRGLMGGPWALQVWKRTEAGAFRQVYAGDGPAYSEAIDAWLVVTDDGTRLRVADDEAGQRRWPTERERAEAELRRAEAAEGEVAALRAALAAMRASAT